MLSRVFEVKRYVSMFFVAWVAFALTCAHHDKITDFIPVAHLAPPRSAGARSAFRSDRTVRYKELLALGNAACDSIGPNVNAGGIVMFSPEFAATDMERTVRVKTTTSEGNVVVNKRYKCIGVKWTDENYAAHEEQMCDDAAFCVQHLLSITSPHARTEL